MLPRTKSCLSQGTRSEKKKKRKKGLYYSSRKDLERSRMRSANKEFKFRGPSKLLDFGNAEVVDIAGLTNGALHAVQEVEEVMIVDFNKAACATEVNIGPAPTFWKFFAIDICTFRNLKIYVKNANDTAFE
jgi:hypothetical protein